MIAFIENLTRKKAVKMGLGFKILMGIVIATAALNIWSFYKTTGKNGENKNGKNERPNPPEADGQEGDENGN